MTGIRYAMAAVAAVLGIATMVVSGAREGEAQRRDRQDFAWQETMKRGAVLEVHGLHGDLAVRGARGRTAEVSARKSARRGGDPDRVRIEVEERGDHVIICARWPLRSGGYTRCGSSDWNGDKLEERHVEVDFDVLVPAGVRFVGRTVNGGVEAEDLESPVTLATVNGRVKLSTTEIGEATTVNGSIDAEIGRTDWDDELRFQTVNGSIDVAMPRGLDTEFEARTVNGSIQSAFSMDVRSRTRPRYGGPRRLEGTIGRGGRELRIETVNGSIHLRSRGRP